MESSVLAVDRLRGKQALEGSEPLACESAGSPADAAQPLTLARENLVAEQLDLDPSSREPLEWSPKFESLFQRLLRLERDDSRRVLIWDRLLLLLSISTSQSSWRKLKRL